MRLNRKSRDQGTERSSVFCTKHPRPGKELAEEMALQFSRALRRLATVPLYRSSAQGTRLASTKPDPGVQLFSLRCLTILISPSFFRAEDTIPGDMEQATGLERKELEALMQGKEVIPINAHLGTALLTGVCFHAGSVQHVRSVWTQRDSGEANHCPVDV